MAPMLYYWLLLAAFALPTLWLERRKLFAIAGRASLPPAPPDSDPHHHHPAPPPPAAYLAFRRNYALVFTLMTAGDWLQGPYIYALYEHYGFSPRSIGRLFVAGFASAALLGAAAGALADTHGRKKAALGYALACGLSCATKHSRSYAVLLGGRLLGGLATSLLFVAFEAWAVAEHARRGFAPALLADLFTRAVLLGNGVGAVAAGLAGHGLVTTLGLGVVAPFDLAVALLAVGAAVVWRTWGENYGGGGGGGEGGRGAAAGKEEQERAGGGASGEEEGGEEGVGGAAAAAAGAQHQHHHHRHPHHAAAAEETGAGAASAVAAAPAPAKRGAAAAAKGGGGRGGGRAAGSSVTGGALSQLRQALAVVRRDERVALLGLMQALFESSMYAFVFLWTPALGQTARGGGGGGAAGGAARGGGWGGGGGAGRAAKAGPAGGDGVDGELPHGLIFAIFMLASMLGAAIAGRLMERADREGGGGGGGGAARGENNNGGDGDGDGDGDGRHGPTPSKGGAAGPRRPRPSSRPWRVEEYMQAVFALSALAMAVPAACHWRRERALSGPAGLPPRDAAASRELAAQLGAFCAFEVATGAFWPSMMRMRARYLPEAQRSTLMALFRAPLSAAVCLILWRAAQLALSSLFAMCCGLLLGAAACQRRLARITAVTSTSASAGAGGGGPRSSSSARPLTRDEEEGEMAVVLMLNGGGGGKGGAR